MAQAELIGSLKVMSLATLLSINCNEYKTVRIEVKQDQQQGNIYIDKGKIIHAEFADETGESAFNKIFALKEGNFSIFSGELTASRTIERSWSNLVLESARLQDENSLQASEETDWDNLDLSDFGFDLTEKTMGEQEERLLKALQRLPGVETVTLLAPDFTISGQLSKPDSVDFTPALKLLFEIGQHSRQHLNAGSLSHLVIRGLKNLILINRGQDILILIIKEAGNPEKLMEEIYLNIKRYR